MDEIVNRLGVVQGFIEFAWLWLNRERGVGVAKSGGVRRERIGGVGQCAEVGIQFTCEINQHFDVVGFLVRFAVMNEECFDGFLCRLKQSISKHFHDRVLTDGVGEGKPRFIRGLSVPIFVRAY